MLGPGVIRVFCERWWGRLPLPLTEAGRAAGYWWDITMRTSTPARTVTFWEGVTFLTAALPVSWRNCWRAALLRERGTRCFP